MTLFLDISSTCTGYTIAKKVNGKIEIKKYGALWFEKDSSISEKCYFLYRFIINTNFDYKLDRIVFEQFSFNMQNRKGSLVLPQLQGAVMVASEKIELPSEQITPQTWRKSCGIKKIKENGVTDWKLPTKKYFDEKMDIPEKIESNITGNLRQTPYDVYDSLGICEGWFKLKEQYEK